jgi:hypothetical protein
MDCLPCHLGQAGLVTVTHPHARLETNDSRQVLRLSEEFVTETFRDGLWQRLNAAHGCLVDEFEEEELPCPTLEAVADEVRKHAATCRIPKLQKELLEVAEFLDQSREQGSAVWVCL